MQPREKKLRNAEVIRLAKLGNSVPALSTQFHISRQRIIQILGRSGVRKVTKKRPHPRFVGSILGEEVKNALKQYCDENDISMSQFVSKAVRDTLHAKGVTFAPSFQSREVDVPLPLEAESQ